MDTHLRQKHFQDSLQHKTTERDLYRSQGWEEQAMMYQEQINDVSKKQEELSSSSWLSGAIDVLSFVAIPLLPPPYRFAAIVIAGVLKMVIK
ncbi:hypothetical protein GDO78_020655 [Eleutherodactylus coqui]|uniref:Uncharacterized protein n=2 Tax=Eleutherodactylus coqui TaxID=57060 RepID=A0A8J6E8M7_ELECQ|nr:hypothetical protein GDO78_020655 [Eleutherodactylus coqui]